MSPFDRLIAALVQERGLDPRTVVFDIHIEEREGRLVAAGATTSAGAVEELLARAAAEFHADVVDEVVRLPDPALGDQVHALVTAAIAPVHAEPRVSSTQVSQYVLGHRLDLLSRTDVWWRVRGEDGYIGWVHDGYLAVGSAEWAQAWERGQGGEPMVSLGAEITDEEGRRLGRLPWGARVIRNAPGWVRLPDGRQVVVAAGEVVEADRLTDWFPPRGESVVRTARRWYGTPYLWGGVTTCGADCSGFVQSIFWMHGIALPRDADQQVRVGSVVEPGPDLSGVRAGDLLFFSERPGRVTHVAISVGGSQIIHSALSNGGVAENDLLGEDAVGPRLREILTTVKRVLPD
ncbi:MAG TPA: SH3 domain-containing C40 family peptidase [Nannocystis sp.]